MPLRDFSIRPNEEVLNALNTTLKGLSGDEANLRLRKYGKNLVREKKEKSILIKFLNNLKSPLIVILILISCVSFVMGSSVDAIIIFAMVIMSTLLNFIQEHKADKAAQALQNRLVTKVDVIREGKRVMLKSQDLCPGDIIEFTAGDLIPAECRVLKAKDFFVNESSLTGESFPVEKTSDPLSFVDATTDMNLKNIVYCGANVVTGTATAVVLATGANTEYGKMSVKLADTSEENEFTKGVDKFSVMILKIIVFFVLFIFLVNALIKGNVFESLMFSVAVAVGLTPEFLPMIMTVTMGKGSLAMSKKGVIVKKLVAIPSFGSMDVLCTDKTGTLTQDKIQLVKYTDLNGDHSELVFEYAYLNSVYQTGVQNPLDQAVLDCREQDISSYEKIDEIPFDNYRRRQSVVVKKNNKKILITKGAPEDIFSVCKSYNLNNQTLPLNSQVAQKLINQYYQMSKEGFRVLAVASRVVNDGKNFYHKEDEKDLEVLGFTAFLDPPKIDAPDAVGTMTRLGIEVKILTGDNELIAQKIARDTQLPIKGVLNGRDLEGLSDEALRLKVRNTTIFARVSPDLKSRIITALRNDGHVVGYMGDGINDALSLKNADVGISVDNAVDVAKESADIILTRKSLHILGDGVLEGRKTFGNTMKYIMMGLSSNFGNMFSVLGAVLFLPFLPMLPIQILVNNFLYDFSQIAIPTDNVDKEFLQKPKRWSMRFIRNFMFVFGPISSFYDFATYFILFVIFKAGAGTFQTGWFMESLASQTLVIYFIRTKKLPFIQSNPSIPLLLSTIIVVAVGWFLPFTFMGKLLGFVPLPPTIMITITAIVISYLFVVELGKRIFYKYATTI